MVSDKAALHPLICAVSISSGLVINALGMPQAQYNTATHYFSGRGVKQDMPKAAEYFEKAAQAGMPQAMVSDRLPLLVLGFSSFLLTHAGSLAPSGQSR